MDLPITVADENGWEGAIAGSRKEGPEGQNGEPLDKVI